VLNLYGTLLPVVDLYTRLGVPRPRIEPDQHLLVISAQTRFLLWLDSVDSIVEVDTQRLVAVETSTSPTLAPYMVQVDERSMPVLSVEMLDPGTILRKGQPSE
jgi:chemotaxis signal transduction protein